MDAGAVLAAGVSEDALVDAIHVAALFNMIDRLADSFGWYVPPDEAFAGRAPSMLESGYELLSLRPAPPAGPGRSESGGSSPARSGPL